jgi:CheY-like chemotaxis protein
MATATLSATLNPRISELRLPPIEPILVIENDGALRTILRRLFSLEGYEVDVVPDGVCGSQKLRPRAPAVVNSVCRVRDPPDVIFGGKLRI